MGNPNLTNFLPVPTPPPDRIASCAIAGGTTFRVALEGILFGFDSRKEPPEHQPHWGILPPVSNAEEFCHHWVGLIEKGCQGFVHVDDRTGTLQELFGGHRFLAPYLDEIQQATNLEELCNILAGKPTSLPLGSIRRYVEAIALQESIKVFSHGSNGDVVNGFLAPARLLGDEGERSQQRKTWESYWQPFTEKVLTVENADFELGRELAEACGPIGRWIKSEGQEEEALNDSDLERVMMLLTQIRTLSDQRSRISSNSPAETGVLGPLGEEGGFKLLVVDDHAKTWYPVFELLLQELRRKLERDLKIDLSIDGKFLADAEQKDVFFGSYDLVLLDVFLGQDRGTGILEELRRDFSQLPVLLWTTSRDEEITGAAQLANGILLKKTVTRDAMIKILAQWLPRGRALRSKTLPNPFFHHTIQSPDLRELAVDYHEWCLKQLDSFHALDGSFFRFFTDHGGRHIVKLWDLLEKAIEPFLHRDETLFPSARAPREREIEITGLYLAVICHELGMFPMRVGEKVEDFANLPKEYLHDVRSLHAVRGMVLIVDGIGEHWNDIRGKELGNRLHSESFGELAFRLAALVGYHARVFKSLSGAPFLGLDGDSPSQDPQHLLDLEARINKLKAPSATPFRSGQEFEDALKSIAGKFADETARERLRKQCALFRFVDALDVSFTRNPPEFLSLNGKLPFKQYRENLKREVCAKAEIVDGNVKAEMRVERPEVGQIQEIISYLSSSKIGNGEANQRANEALKNGSVVSYPWKPAAGDDGSFAWSNDDLETSSAVCLQEPLDEWLERVWMLIVDGDGHSDFHQHLRELGILDPNAQDPTLTRKGAELIASVTALSVAGELLDEYRAIVEAGLEMRLVIEEEGWIWGTSWELDKFPSLNRFLSEESTRDC